MLVTVEYNEWCGPDSSTKFICIESLSNWLDSFREDACAIQFIRILGMTDKEAFFDYHATLRAPGE
jgi:hypothetical protein